MWVWSVRNCLIDINVRCRSFGMWFIDSYNLTSNMFT